MYFIRLFLARNTRLLPVLNFFVNASNFVRLIAAKTTLFLSSQPFNITHYFQHLSAKKYDYKLEDFQI